VLVPGLEAIVIVPICPHSLTTRPLVVPANEEITVKTCSECELVYLTADGQENFNLKGNDTVFIRKYEKKAKLILLERENNGFYSVLREKLHWGLAPKG
jgi:NAD+ kinase